MWVVAFATISVSLFSVKSQLSVTWNGTTITGPVLIYTDELPVNSSTNTIGNPSSPGALMCRYEGSARVSWHYTTGVFVRNTSFNDIFKAITTREGVTPSMSQLLQNQDSQNFNINDNGNGVWHCRLNASGHQDYDSDSPGRYKEQINVAIYSRRGRGIITTNTVLFSSSFDSIPPTFTLVGDTSGGPPTNYHWTRNGEVITDGGPFSISISLNIAPNESMWEASLESRYRSTLTVTDRLPGLYQYSVTNRATNITRTTSFIVEGAAPPTNIAAIQSGLYTVLVSWTAPLTPPDRGYLITVDQGQVSATAATSPHTIILSQLQLGVHNITMMSLSSQHIPSISVGPVEVAIQGPLMPNLTYSVTGTSATVSWTQPPFSFTPVSYVVVLSRLAGSSEQMLCAGSRPLVDALSNVTSVEFNNLQESNIYQVNVTVLFDAFGISQSQFAVLNFTTLSNGSTFTSADLSIAVVLTFLLTIILYTAVLLTGCGIVCVHNSKRNGTGEAMQPAVYEEVDSKLRRGTDNDGGIAMIENAAYGPMTATQQPQTSIYAQPSKTGK